MLGIIKSALELSNAMVMVAYLVGLVRVLDLGGEEVDLILGLSLHDGLLGQLRERSKLGILETTDLITVLEQGRVMG